MTDQELHMTYFFEWRHPDVEAGSEKEKEMMELYKKMGKLAVDKSVETIRRMVVAGEL
jgi:Domain of unknown function (DUF1857)